MTLGESVKCVIKYLHTTCFPDLLTPVANLFRTSLPQVIQKRSPEKRNKADLEKGELAERADAKLAIYLF